jgi:hypothetical protein
MKKPPLRFMKNEYIEDVTAQRIREYEAKASTVVKFPVPVEEIIEQVLDLTILWDAIDEQPGELILGGLQAKKRTILLNEKHMKLFNEKPGLLRSTQGHEAGHWDIDIDKSNLDGPSLFGDQGEGGIVHRHASKTDDLIEVLLSLAHQNEQAYRAYKKLTAGQDTPDQKSAVDRYQSALLMPAWLLQEAATRYDLTVWTQLYRLAEVAQVNISNLVTRLRRLGMIFIPKGSKTIYRSEDEFTGQGSLF